MTQFRYCPQCRAALIQDENYPRCPHDHFTHYGNPKPTVSIWPLKDGQVLLAKRGIEPLKGAWDVIGGFLKANEDPRDGVRREAKEETGLAIEPTQLLGIYPDHYDDPDDYTLNLHYVGEIKGGTPKAQDDVASLHWVPINDIDFTSGFQNARAALKDFKVWFTSYSTKKIRRRSGK